MEAREKKGTKPERYSMDEVVRALQLTGGIRSAAAQKLGCSGQTVSNYVSRYPELRSVIREAEAATLDLAESALLSLIRNRHPGSIHFYLRTKGKHRGYGARPELIAAEPKIDLSLLTERELHMLEVALKIIEKLQQKCQSHVCDV